MPALLQFLKDNVKFAYGGLGVLGLLFGAKDIKDIATSDNKFKALFKTIKDLILVRVALITAFTAVGSAIRALVRDTGSLDAAMKRLEDVQRAQRIFSPLVGGAKSARQHVANLLVFASNTPFRFEGIVEADRNLQTMTRGAFAGTGALQTIGNAAAKSNNSIEESARAVGEFYQALHNGEPINRSVDGLRQMGLISETAAQHLDRLAASGASSIQMASSLTRALEESRGGMAAYAKSVEGINTAHEKAVESAKAAFGREFVKPPIESTQNYTKTLVAITPALETVGKGFGVFSNSMANIGSRVVKASAESGILGTAIKGIGLAVGVLAGVLTAVGIVALAQFSAGLVGVGVAAGGLTGALALLGGATGFGLIALTIGAVGYGLYKVNKAFNDSGKEVRELRSAHRAAQAAIDAHAASIQDLTGLHEAYGKAISHVIDLQNELNDATQKGDTRKIQEINRAIEEAGRHLAALPKGTEIATPERGRVIEQRLESRVAREEARFEEAMRREPGRAPELLGQRAQRLEERAAIGQQGLQARQRVAEAQGTREAEASTHRAAIGRFETILGQGKKLTNEDQKRYEFSRTSLAQIESETLRIQETEGKGYAVGFEAQAQRLEAAQRANVLEKAAAKEKDEGFRKDFLRQAELERIRAGGAEAPVVGQDVGRRVQDLRATAQDLSKVEANATEFEIAARARESERIDLLRTQQVTRAGMAAETGAVRARLAGMPRERERFEDIGAFIQHFEEYRRDFGRDEALSMALQKRSNELLEQTPGSIKPIADSLTRIGGGGGVGGPSGDPAQRVRQRIAQLTADANGILNRIEQNTKGLTAEPGGGAPRPELERPPGAAGTPEATETKPVTGAEPKQFETLPGPTIKGPETAATTGNILFPATPLELPPAKPTGFLGGLGRSISEIGKLFTPGTGQPAKGEAPTIAAPLSQQFGFGTGGKSPLFILRENLSKILPGIVKSPAELTGETPGAISGPPPATTPAAKEIKPSENGTFSMQFATPPGRRAEQKRIREEAVKNQTSTLTPVPSAAPTKPKRVPEPEPETEERIHKRREAIIESNRKEREAKGIPEVPSYATPTPAPTPTGPPLSGENIRKLIDLVPVPALTASMGKGMTGPVAEIPEIPAPKTEVVPTKPSIEISGGGPSTSKPPPASTALTPPTKTGEGPLAEQFPEAAAGLVRGSIIKGGENRPAAEQYPEAEKGLARGSIVTGGENKPMAEQYPSLVSALGKTIGTKESPLPSIEPTPGRVILSSLNSTKSTAEALQSAGKSSGEKSSAQAEMLSTLKAINRGTHQSNSHLGVIAEKPAGVQ